MALPLENVREELLRAGIAPRHAGRYVTELREHLVDLTERECSAGLDVHAAGERARAVLGSDALLVREMISTAPRSLTARIPWVVFVLVPAIVLLSAVGTIDYSMKQLLDPVQAAWPGGVPNTYTGLIAVTSFITNYLVGPLIAAGSIAFALRQRASSPWVWVGLGLIALFSALLGFHMNIYPPHGAEPGGAVFSAVPVVVVDGRANAAATLTMVVTRAVVLYALATLAYRTLQVRHISLQA
jgi:hypothetical protein